MTKEESLAKNKTELHNAPKNYYGSQYVSYYRDKFYWGLTDHDGTFDWKEINGDFYCQLLTKK